MTLQQEAAQARVPARQTLIWIKARLAGAK
jgi:hypothetical protein